MFIFFENASKINNWFERKGYSDGTLYQKMYQYFQDNSSLQYGSLFDHLNDALTQSGYGEVLVQDKLTTMFIEKTGITYRKDAERKFFQDETLDMFATGALSTLTDDDGNTVRDDDGNIVTG